MLSNTNYFSASSSKTTSSGTAVCPLSRPCTGEAAAPTVPDVAPGAGVAPALRGAPPGARTADLHAEAVLRPGHVTTGNTKEGTRPG